MKQCMVIGHQGQDGRILCSMLRKSDFRVLGIGRGEVDITKSSHVAELVQAVRPDLIYYLPAFHHSADEKIDLTDAEVFQKSFEVHVLGAVSFLEAIRRASPQSRFFYAASSHVFGSPVETPQTERTPFNPLNIYGISKSAGIQACRFYRATHKIFAASGILYNHESPWRSEKFVSQKIVQGALKISRGTASTITLGNLDAEIDWGYAPDFVNAMVRIMALDAPEDFIVATGESHSVREFAEIALRTLDLNPIDHLKEDKSLIRKTHTRLVGDSSLLRAKTGWRPSLTFSEMVTTLVKTALHES
jgi:GDPmannose 4,6-dehydratase